MAISKKKGSYTDSRSIAASDPLLEQLKGIFAEYPEGVSAAHEFLLNPDELSFLQIGSEDNTWRVRPTAVDRHVNGVSDRIELWTKNSDR